MSGGEVVIREAGTADAAQLFELIRSLGHDVDAGGIARRTHDLQSSGLPQLVAIENEAVVGLCGLHEMTAIHRSEPVGRITILVVHEQRRGRGIGRSLIVAAEAHLRRRGCGLIEVTSNDRLTDAHSFYEHLGYRRTSKRFAKSL